MLACFRSGRPDRCEDDTEDSHVVVDHEHERAAHEIRVAQDENELDDVEEDGEDEVGDRNPKERLETLEVPA